MPLHFGTEERAVPLRRARQFVRAVRADLHRGGVERGDRMIGKEFTLHDQGGERAPTLTEGRQRQVQPREVPLRLDRAGVGEGRLRGPVAGHREDAGAEERLAVVLEQSRVQPLPDDRLIHGARLVRRQDAALHGLAVELQVERVDHHPAAEREDQVELALIGGRVAQRELHRHPGDRAVDLHIERRGLDVNGLGYGVPSGGDRRRGLLELLEERRPGHRRQGQPRDGHVGDVDLFHPVAEGRQQARGLLLQPRGRWEFAGPHLARGGRDLGEGEGRKEEGEQERAHGGLLGVIQGLGRRPGPRVPEVGGPWTGPGPGSGSRSLPGCSVRGLGGCFPPTESPGPVGQVRPQLGRTGPPPNAAIFQTDSWAGGRAERSPCDARAQRGPDPTRRQRACRRHHRGGGKSAPPGCG